MKIKTKFKQNLLLITAAFIIGKLSFSHNYDPITFTVSAEYIAPFEIELENDGNWDLGTYILGNTRTSVSKSFYIKARTAPNTRVRITAQSDSASNFRKSSRIELYKDGIADFNKIHINWDIPNNEFTMNSSGTHSSQINFSTIKELNDPSEGNYSRGDSMVIKMETF